MVSKVTQLLHEYQGLFPMKFSEIKGIIVSVGDILSWVEARSSVKACIRKCRISLLWRSQSYWLCRRRKDVSELKIWPLEKIKFGGAGTLTVLTACIDEILRNIPPFGQDICRIWCLQCTVMTDFVDGFYKKTPTTTKFALRIFLSFTIEPMTANHELQELVREFEQGGMPNLFIHPPVSTPHKETSPTPTQPM